MPDQPPDIYQMTYETHAMVKVLVDRDDDKEDRLRSLERDRNKVMGLFSIGAFSTFAAALHHFWDSVKDMVR